MTGKPSWTMKKHITGMTREELFELKAVVRRTMEEEMEMYSEVWLTADEMCKYFATMKKAWLDRYGHALPHRDPGVTDEVGRYHRSSRLYPRNKIQRMFASGEIEKLVCRAVVS
jgi:hypothetical protein